MLHAKGKCCINNSSDDFRIIGKEKGRTMLNWFYLRNDIMAYCVNKSNLAVFDLCI